jgi:hypothetical protein
VEGWQTAQPDDGAVDSSFQDDSIKNDILIILEISVFEHGAHRIHRKNTIKIPYCFVISVLNIIKTKTEF